MALVKIRTSKLRSMLHITQSALAARTGLTKTTISNLESGHQTKIALDTIAKLCLALNCTPSDLFELSERQEESVWERQKTALAPFIGSLECTIAFNPDKLDSDLAKITNKKLELIFSQI